MLAVVVSRAQSPGDHQIVVQLPDTSRLREKVRIALVRKNFIVKDVGSRDTLSTYPRDMDMLSMVIFARFDDQGVTFTGYYTTKKMDDFGYTRIGKSYKRTNYYKGSKTWRMLQAVAGSIGGELSYGH